MRAQHYFASELLIGLIVLGLGCGGALKTGTAKKPANNKPADDGTCPSARSLCGTGVFAICVDLQDDPDHCGTCDRACTSGIACQAGVCQQTVCTGAISFSGQPGTSTPDASGQPTTSVSDAVPGGSLAFDLFADVNGDGRLDLVDSHVGLGGLHANTFRVSLGQPGGGFATPDTYHSAFDIRDISAMDVNADGMDDLLVFSTVDLTVPPSRVEVWLGHTDGHLTLSSATDVSGMAFLTAVGDISGDGWPDLVMASTYSQEEISVYLSDNTGALHLSKTYATGLTFAIYIRDWNGDGSPDLVVLSSSVVILYNRGNGTFEQPVDCGVSITSLGNGFVVADFNRDGRMDLAAGAIGASNASIGVILGLGECAFAPISYYDIGGSTPPMLRAVDMNGDGQLDLIGISDVVSLGQNGLANGPGEYLLTVLLGNGDGTFHVQDTAISLGADTIDTIGLGVAVGEATGDQRPDVIVTSGDGRVTTLENTCQ
jgi:uncharacterized protein (DUF2141 family)